MTDEPVTPDPADPSAGGRPPTEEELRAAYEAEIKRLRVEDVLAQTIVSLLNLGARKAGLAPGTEDERDLDQVRLAIEGARGLLPVAEGALGPDAGPIREALSQLQLAYARLAGESPEEDGGAGEPAAGEEAPGEGQAPGAAQAGGEAGPGPAQRSGRLWVPGE